MNDEPNQPLSGEPHGRGEFDIPEKFPEKSPVEPGTGQTTGDPPPRVQASPPPPPPPPPPYWGAPAGQGGFYAGMPPYYPPFGPPIGGRPPRRGSPFLRVLLILICIGFLFCLIALATVVTAIFKGGESSTTGLAFADKIGVVRIEGEIMQGDEKQFWIHWLYKMGENDRIRGVVVRVDSPGGTVGASQEIYSAITKLRERSQKPVFVSMGDTAASGGYYLAAAAERIFALKGTLTGSIGVIYSKPQVSELAKRAGVDVEVVKSGKFKDSGRWTRPLDDEDKEVIGQMIQSTLDQFLDDILQYREKALETAFMRLSADELAKFKFAGIVPPGASRARAFLSQMADGRPYTGEQAFKLGLVDEIGTLDDAINALAQKVGIKGRPEVLEPTRRPTLRDLLRTGASTILPSGHAALRYMIDMPGLNVE